MLLRLLPAEFRGDFGPEMEQVFVEQRAEVDRHGDKMGVWRLWWETAKGIFSTAPREHLAMLRQDSGFALRMMRKNLGFTIAAIVVLGPGIAAPRLTANLLGLFALVALAIAAAGIGGVMALSVSQRTHEIGVRMAIGARPAEIVFMVLRQGMMLVFAGLALGLAGAFALTHAMRSLLFGVTPTDPITFGLVAAALLVAAFAACCIPARRAVQVDPLRALRAE
jgi:hypothetical protein